MVSTILKEPLEMETEYEKVSPAFSDEESVKAMESNLVSKIAKPA